MPSPVAGNVSGSTRNKENEMSKRNNKTIWKTVIKAADLKVSIGHQQHQSGGGAHDSRPRKQRTRAASNTKAIREFS